MGKVEELACGWRVRDRVFGEVFEAAGFVEAVEGGGGEEGEKGEVGGGGG